MNTFHELIQNLSHPGSYDYPISNIRVIETHISAVILTGSYAYKIKKPVNLGFLDFSSLDQRQFFCTEELRLNRRLSPQIYLEVLPITGSITHPTIGGNGKPIEWAIKMRQFDPDQQFDHLLAHNQLQSKWIDKLVPIIVEFHKHAKAAPLDSPFCLPETIYEPMKQNFDQLREWQPDPTQNNQIEAIAEWTERQYRDLNNVLTSRIQKGHIRECHGDMHLANIALFHQEIVIFDGIEFNEYFRWIDTANDVAFLLMDLESRKANKMAWRFLNQWLEESGDYTALQVLAFYKAYRAMVRTKVAGIRLNQANITPSDKRATLAIFRDYLKIAERYTLTQRPFMILMHGFSGSGKTTIANQLASDMEAIRIRSDIERKRLAGQPAKTHEENSYKQGIYTSSWTDRTYDHLLEISEMTLKAGYPIIVDAAFLNEEKRELFKALANKLNVDFLILSIQAELDVLRDRLRNRKDDISDADTAILEKQITSSQPLSPDEPHLVLNSELPIPLQTIQELLRKS